MKKMGCAAAACALLLCLLCLAVPDGQILWEASDALYTGTDLPAPAWSLLPYGAGLAASAALAWAVSCGLVRRRTTRCAAVCWLAWSLALGILLSRMLYCVIEPAYYNPKWLARLAVLRLWDGGMAMTGAILGALLAVRMAPGGKALAPTALPLFVAGARLSERFTQIGYGPSVSMEGMLARQVGYATRLNVSVLEAVMALVIFLCVVLLPRWAQRRRLELTDDDRLRAFVLLYGISQIFMESLRRDRHMVWGFTKVQQILAILMVLITLLMMAKDAPGRLHALRITLLAAVPLIALEFALDRADVSILLLYGVYLLILALYLRGVYRVFRQSLPSRSGEN